MTQLDGFSNFADSTLQTWNVPGAAIAVVHQGKVVFSEGYGLRDVAGGLPVTTETIFPIGSATKAFSATTLGILVDDGTLGWEQPIQDLVPSFRLEDEFASQRMTALDLLSHRSGLPGHDFAWIGSDRTRQELLDALKHLTPNKDFRTHFQYSNLMYMVTAVVAEAASGRPWEELVRSRLIEPLGMKHTSLTAQEAAQSENYALPYRLTKAGRKALAFGKTDTKTNAIAPAGAIHSTAVDMAKWVSFNLGHGPSDVISAENRRLQQRPQTPIVSMQPFDFIWQHAEIGDVSYGLGWFMYPYRGHKIVEHGGNVSGFSALVSLMPDQDLGIVILTNLEGRPVNLAPTVLAYDIYDRFLGLERVDWQDRIYTVIEGVVAHLGQEGDKLASEQKGSISPESLGELVGDYTHLGYGRVLVALEEPDLLTLKLNDLACGLVYVEDDQFRLEHEMFELGLPVTFSRDERGDVTTVTVLLEQTLAPIEFHRSPTVVSANSVPQ